MKQIATIAVVGGGTAGFMAALALKIKIPRLDVTVIRSPDIGIIGVGEGSTPPFTNFIHNFLGISLKEFVRGCQPGIKTGTCFHWGPRPRFLFPLGMHSVLKVNALPKAMGYYSQFGDFEAATPMSARMKFNRTFRLNEQNSLLIDPQYAYHMENERFATFLETKARSVGIHIVDATIEHVSQDDHGVTALHLTDNRQISADLYVDCSGFRSLLIGKALGEPRIDYKSTLACDRAVVGGWVRPAGVPMLSYTQSDTMDAGWCWQIDHPDRSNRGYVYSSAFISDDDAEKEFRSKNPLLGPTRVIKFASGRSVRSWVKNVVAIGNSSGFVEPLEATSLSAVATRCVLLVEQLLDSDGVISPPMPTLFNFNTNALWDAVRDFLSLHYRFNTRLSTPFWLDRQHNTDLANAAGLVEYYSNVGPSPNLLQFYVTRVAIFDFAGYLAILTGLAVPSSYLYRPSAGELELWSQWCESNNKAAQSLATAEQTLAIIAECQPVR